MYGAFAYQELLNKYNIDINKPCKGEWENLCGTEKDKLDENFIETFKDHVSWRLVTRYCNLSEDFIRKHADLVDWVEVSSYEQLSPEFVEEYKDKFNWSDLSQKLAMTKEQLLQYVDRIDWDRAPTYQPKVDGDVIEAVLASKKKDEFNWHGALVNVKMSEEFIEKHADDIEKANKWELVSYYQKLSEEFMMKWAKKMNWNYVSQRQKLSDKFIRENLSKLNKQWLLNYQKGMSEELVKELKKSA
jgi:hypothetical protein